AIGVSDATRTQHHTARRWFARRRRKRKQQKHDACTAVARVRINSIDVVELIYWMDQYFRTRPAPSISRVAQIKRERSTPSSSSSSASSSYSTTSSSLQVPLPPLNFCSRHSPMASTSSNSLNLGKL